MHNAMPGLLPGISPAAAALARRPFLRQSIITGAGSAESTGTLDYASVGGMRVGRFLSDQSCITRHPIALAQTAQSYLFVAVQTRGQTTIEQYGRHMQLPAGSWGLCDAPKPCVSSHVGGVEQLHFLIPRRQIRLGIDPRFVVGRSFDSGSRVATLMCETIGVLFEELPKLGARRAEALADVVLGLFHLAVNERIEQPQSLSVQDDMRERICAHVESRLRDPRLSLDEIAADLSCTKRYLHMVFASEDRTLNQYIWARRLERCRSDLVNPALRERSITDIAMRWGFSNLSHFSRAFRDQFGQSPREARASGIEHSAA